MQTYKFTLKSSVHTGESTYTQSQYVHLCPTHVNVFLTSLEIREVSKTLKQKSPNSQLHMGYNFNLGQCKALQSQQL